VTDCAWYSPGTRRPRRSNLVTAAEALREAVTFARTGARAADACVHDARQAIASIRWAGDLFDQLGGRLVDADDLLPER
jgi:hypothetical protein